MTAPKRPEQLDSPLLPVIFRHTSRVQVWVYRKTNGWIGPFKSAASGDRCAR